MNTFAVFTLAALLLAAEGPPDSGCPDPYGRMVAANCAVLPSEEGRAYCASAYLPSGPTDYQFNNRRRLARRIAYDLAKGECERREIAAKVLFRMHAEELDRVAGRPSQMWKCEEK